MDIHPNALQQAGLFQRLAPTQHGMTHQRVVGLQKAWGHGLAQRLLLQKAQGPKAAVGEKGLIGKAQLKPQRGEQDRLAGGR